jgi:NADPH-dependent curcumin reductase CurA
MSKWINEGRIKWKETVYEGLENAPKAFIGLFKGENIGRTLVRLGHIHWMVISLGTCGFN